jgi:hypothetical protein
LFLEEVFQHFLVLSHCFGVLGVDLTKKRAGDLVHTFEDGLPGGIQFHCLCCRSMESLSKKCSAYETGENYHKNAQNYPHGLSPVKEKMFLP